MDIVFLGNGRCYHTMDWFRSAQQLKPGSTPILMTDLIEGESFKKLIKADDRVKKLFIIDRLLFKKQSRLGNVWRNIIKFALLPFQALLLRKHLKHYPRPLLHAHSSYYILLARLSGCPYIGTPQGSEVLVRPYRSRLYKSMIRFAFSRAACVTVDSEAMKKAAMGVTGIKPVIIQNGINVAAIRSVMYEAERKNRLLSIRALSPNYRIEALLLARNKTLPKVPISFCYPFVEEAYKDMIATYYIDQDQSLGRLDREALYKLLLATQLVVSIPESDSSPRSVYEAIFCGAIVATTNAAWVNVLPACMKKRLFIVDIEDKNWLKVALDYASIHSKGTYRPSEEALLCYDQLSSMKRFYNDIYPKAYAACGEQRAL